MSDYICDNILIRILQHLPVRSILRFRSVCKGWKDLLDSHEFMHAHLALQNPQLLLQFSDEPQFSSAELRSPPLVRDLTTPLHRPSNTLVVGTLHGVVCLYESATRRFHLWNPSIRKFSTLTLPSNAQTQSGIGRAFWIDPCTKEFKIMLLTICHAPAPITPRISGIVYSSIKHGWTAIPPIEIDQDWLISYLSGYAVMIAGKAHWKASYNLDVYRVSVIVCFDFTQESFEVIEMPHDGEIMQYHGLLSAVDCGHTKCQIHVRQQGKWVNVFSFNTIHDIVESSMIMLGVMNELFWVLIEARVAYVQGSPVWPTKLRWYDSRVGYIPFPSDKIYNSSTSNFVESLLFP